MSKINILVHEEVGCPANLLFACSDKEKLVNQAKMLSGFEETVQNYEWAKDWETVRIKEVHVIPVENKKIVRLRELLESPIERLWEQAQDLFDEDDEEVKELLRSLYEARQIMNIEQPFWCECDDNCMCESAAEANGEIYG